MERSTSGLRPGMERSLSEGLRSGSGQRSISPGSPGSPFSRVGPGRIAGTGSVMRTVSPGSVMSGVPNQLAVLANRPYNNKPETQYSKPDTEPDTQYSTSEVTETRRYSTSEAPDSRKQSVQAKDLVEKSKNLTKDMLHKHNRIVQGLDTAQTLDNLRMKQLQIELQKGALQLQMEQLKSDKRGDEGQDAELMNALQDINNELEEVKKLEVLAGDSGLPMPPGLSITQGIEKEYDHLGDQLKQIEAQLQQQGKRDTSLEGLKERMETLQEKEKLLEAEIGRRVAEAEQAIMHPG
eukprot:gene13811-4042_t